MRLLSEHESSILKGDLKNIKLPDTTSLYLSDGIQHLFRKVEVNDDDLHDENWLYIPTEKFNAIRQKLIVSSNDNIDKYFPDEPIQGDGFVIYPILIDKQINVVLVDKSAKKLIFKTSIIDSIVDTFRNFHNRGKMETGNMDRFMQVLLESKNSAHDFIRRIFSMIAEEIPESCGGYYYDDNGILKLRMTVGDLKRFDLLPSMVSAQVKDKWHSAIERQMSVLPAESLPDDITLLADAPFYHFVHHGLKDHFTENLICIVFKSDLVSQKIRFIQSVCQQMSKLSLTQFEIGSYIKEYYQANLNRAIEQDFSDFLFKDLNNLIDKQLIVSGVSIVDSKKIIKDCSRCSDNTLHHSSQNPEFIEYINEFITGDEQIDSIHDIYDQTQPSNRRDYFERFDTKSLLIYKPLNHNNQNLIFVISSPFKKNYMAVYRNFLKEAINAYTACLYINEVSKQNQKVKKTEQQLLSRGLLLDKLVSGYFHKISSNLTVVMAEIEKLEHSIDLPDKIKSNILTLEQTLKIKQDTEALSTHVMDLQSITKNLVNNQHESLSCRYFMQILPQYINGYLRNMADTEDIVIDFDIIAEIDHDFQITGSEVIDVFLPFVISIIEKCGHSGIVKMYPYNDFKNEGFTFIFKKSMLAEHNLGEQFDILQRDNILDSNNLFLFSTERKPKNWIHLNIYRSSKIFNNEQHIDSGYYEMS